MSESQPGNAEIARVLRSWYPLLDLAFGKMAWRDTLATVPIIGVPTAIERANIYHAAARKSVEAMCDTAYPYLQAAEDGGLDYAVFNVDPFRFAIRWGKYDGVTIRRNDTDRQKFIQHYGVIEEQGTLFGDMDKTVEEPAKGKIPVVAVGYTVEDDYTEAGLPCWWMGRLALLRERIDVSEFIENVVIYDKPEMAEPAVTDQSPRILARNSELDELRRIAEEIRRGIA